MALLLLNVTYSCGLISVIILLCAWDSYNRELDQISVMITICIAMHNESTKETKYTVYVVEKHLTYHMH